MKPSRFSNQLNMPSDFSVLSDLIQILELLLVKWVSQWDFLGYTMCMSSWMHVVLVADKNNHAIYTASLGGKSDPSSNQSFISPLLTQDDLPLFV